VFFPKPDGAPVDLPRAWVYRLVHMSTAAPTTPPSPLPSSLAPPLVVFDLDGTMIDTAPDLIASLNHVLVGEGLAPIAVDEATAMIGRGARVLIERGFAQNGVAAPGGRADALFQIFLTHYTAHIADASAPYPGLISALDRLAAQGWQFAVCTNKLERLSRQLLDALSLTHRFQAICGADTFAMHKPDPGHLLGTIAAARGRPDRAIMVGDSRTDIDTAKAAGIPVIAVDFGYTEAPVSTFGPDRLISHFDALDEAVAALSEAMRAR
jgi:phosphoglycolate phosphatase